jgi:uncharacterized protein (DUF433 family)
VAEKIATHISRDPAIYGGRPCIDGYRIAVHDIASQSKQGYTPEEIAESFGLTRRQVHAALAYYYDNEEEVDRELAQDEAEIKRRAASDMSPPMQRLRENIKQRRQRRDG